MSLPNPSAIVDRLRDFQKSCRDALIASRKVSDLHEVDRTAAADTIYRIDAIIEPLLDAFCEDWGRTTPLVLIAEGVQDEEGREGARVFPAGSRQEDALIRVLIDPIDGTRGIMYDKRSAWALAAVAPNRGVGTRLRDVEVAVMSELPTSKMGRADVLWAVKGAGARGVRVDLRAGADLRSGADHIAAEEPLLLRPSQAPTLHHGFASIANFFPGTKMLSSGMMEKIAAELLGPADVHNASLFEDQYISTGGQFYELIVGHDRFTADLRPVFYALQSQPQGLCCHPYDCAALLIAEEAGVIVTDEHGQPLDAPMDTTSGVSWAAYANAALRDAIEPVLRRSLVPSGRGKAPSA